MTGLKLKVLDAVLSGYSTTFDIIIHTGFKSSQSSYALSVLEQKKLISRVGYETINGYVYVAYSDYDPKINIQTIYENSLSETFPRKKINKAKILDISVPFSTNENHYGKHPSENRYTWEEVNNEAKQIEYKPNSYINKLNFHLL